MATPYRSPSRSVATRRCISPWPQTTTSCVSGLCTTVTDGSSSTSLWSAWPSLTSSLRSFAEMAMARTGGYGSTLASGGCGCLPAVSVSPVLAWSSLPKPTVSPTAAGPRFSVAWPTSLNTPATRPASSSPASKIVPSPTCPPSTRATDILPPWVVCSVLST